MTTAIHRKDELRARSASETSAERIPTGTNIPSFMLSELLVRNIGRIDL